MIYFQVCLPPWLGKISRFTVLRLLETAFIKLFLAQLALSNHQSPFKTNHINLLKKVCSPCSQKQSFLKKKFPHTLKEGGRARRHYALSSYLFPFLKVLPLPFLVQLIAFQAKPPSQCVFKVTHYGYEILQTVLSLNYKIIQLKKI